MFISEGGMIVRVPASSISQIGRNTQGVRLVNLKRGDKVIAAARVAESDGAGSPAQPMASAGSNPGHNPGKGTGAGEHEGTK